MKKLLLSILVLALLGLLWMLKSNSLLPIFSAANNQPKKDVTLIASQDTDTQSVAIKPTPVQVESSVDVESHPPIVAQMSAVQNEFIQATEFAVAQQWTQAESSFESIIEKSPLVVEAYINLALVYAKTDRIELARDTLVKAMQANPSYSQLFDSWQAVNGILAAQAYARALASEEQEFNGSAMLEATSKMQFLEVIEPSVLVRQQPNLQSDFDRLQIQLLEANEIISRQNEEYAVRVSELETQLKQLSLEIEQSPKTIDNAENHGLGDDSKSVFKN